MSRSETRPASLLAEERVGAYLSLALGPIPLLATFTAAGLAAIYVLGILRVLDVLGWQLLAVIATLLLVALAHRAVLDLSIGGRGLLAFTLHAVVSVMAALLLALLWDGTAPLAILMAWLAPAICIPARVPRPQYIGSILLSLAASALIIILAARPLLPRLPSNTTGSFAAALLVTSMVILFIILVLATLAIRFRALQTRLMGTLVPIIAVPILFTSAIAAFNALSSSQQQFRNSLQAVSSLKRGELDAIAQSTITDLESVQAAPSIRHLLQNPGAADEEYRVNASLAVTQMRTAIVTHPEIDYEEIFILDANGAVILSTYPLDEGMNFENEEFFRQGLTAPAARLARYPGQQNTTGEYKLVASTPFYGDTSAEIIGVTVGVASADAILGILQPAVGLEEVNTYLVDGEMNALISGIPEPRPLQVSEIEAVISNRGGGGSGPFRNYAGTPVLGYFEWIPALQAAVVSEIPQSVVTSRSLAAVLASGLVGLVTIIIAAIAVLSASRAITEPMKGLAGVAERFAAGELSTRASAEREDEIGRLANSFNIMANELQGTIASLEQRVADRTRALELQTMRLRTAAEVARDATLAPTLDELLSRASGLIMDRFDVDHVGIFLLDEKKQYAVLQASPSETGQQMLAANYRVPVGDASPVGRAAQTGEAQLVLRGSRTAVETGDEFHPATQSQLSLPLRTNEGTIGILDLQSKTPGIFTAADTTTIQVLADQLAAAVERGRLLIQVQQRLGQLEQSYQRFTEESWGAYSRTGPQALGYRYDNVRLEPITSVPEEAQQVLLGGSRSTPQSKDEGPDGGQTANLPIRVRGQTLGVISVNFHEGNPPTRTLSMLEQAADRLGTALENVRLLEDSLRRASKERMISEITAKIGSSISVRNVLQTAVEELGRALPGSDVTINFRPQGAQREKEKQP